MYKEKTSTITEKSNISIDISREHSQFVPEVEDCFKEAGFPVSASYMRLSAQELPMQILIFVGGSIAGGVMYDLLKVGIKKALSKFKNTSIVLQDQEGILFGIREDEKGNAVVVSDLREAFSHIKTLDDLIVHLNSLNQSGWTEKRLGELTIKIGSGATPRGGQEAYKKEGISLIRSQNVNDFGFSYKGLAFIDDQQARKLNNVTVQEEDILLNITGDSVARVCKPLRKVLPARVNQHVAIIRPDRKKLDSNFLQYYLLNPPFKKHMLLIASNGATRNAITKGNIEDFKLFLPANLKEQKAIAAVLTSFDDKIELLRQQNQTLEEMAQTLFKEWFVEYRFPGAGKMVDSELGLIPEGWKIGKIGELIKESISGDWGKEEKEGYFTEEVTCVRGTDLEDIKSGASSRAPIRYIKPDKFKKSALKPGDIVIEISGGTEGQSTGRVTYINEEVLESFSGKVICVNFCRTLRPQSGTTFFVFEYLNYFYDRGIFFNWENGTTGIKNLALKDFLTIYDTVIPGNNVIEEFEKIAKKVFQKIQTNNNQIQTLTKLRDSLLPKLMSGEIRVKM